MSNESVIYLGGGKARHRPAKAAHRGWSLWLLLAVWIGTSSAMAAEVVEVRVGKHAKFTRIVFELDRAAGYRIERNDSGSGAGELVVSLQASSRSRRIESKKSLISTVEVEPSGARSVARIQLKESDLQLKEMILNRPPRIVLDVMRSAAGAGSVAGTSKAAPKAAASAMSKANKTGQSASSALASAKNKAKEKTAAAKQATADASAKMGDATDSVIEQAKAARAAAAARIKNSKEATADTAKKMAAKADTALADTKKAGAAAADSAKATAASMTDKVTGAAGDLASGMKGQVDQKIINPVADTAKAVTPNSSASTGAQKPAMKKKPLVAKKKAAAKAKTQKDGGWMTWALAGAGGLLFLGGGLFLASRRRGESVDFSDEYDDDDESEGDSSLSDVNPFSKLDQNPAPEPVLSELTGDRGSANDGESAGFALTGDDDKEEEAVFETGSTEDDMEVISRDDVNESLGMPPTMGGVPEEFMQLMRDMQAKVEGLEGRVEELVDARDRLERQVAAQTEELRVQRAAIARTQRAVRNLARPEDDDQEPTEPALRDPNKD